MKKKIMIVDDNTDLLEELKEIFEGEEFDVSIFSKGKKAVANAPGIKPDIIFLDLKLDKEDGFEVAAELKGIAEMEKTPIITMSAYYTKEIHRGLLDALGIKKHMVKPVQIEEMIRAANEASEEK